MIIWNNITIFVLSIGDKSFRQEHELQKVRILKSPNLK